MLAGLEPRLAPASVIVNTLGDVGLGQVSERPPVVLGFDTADLGDIAVDLFPLQPVV